jgi:N-acetylglutamate synthase-like GNAT family acetyltransferase
VLIRKADISEAELLTDLTVRSKAYWGYSKEFMIECNSELVLPKEKLGNQKYRYMVASSNDELIGYYGLEPITEIEVELSALFLEPRFIGKGLGKLLLLHAMNVASKMGGKKLTLQSDPNAEGFYLANSGILTGKKESLSFPGRYLPTFSIPLQESVNE